MMVVGCAVVGLEDRSRIGRVDRGDRASLILVNRIAGTVLDVRDRWMVRVTAEPIVDEALDDPAPSEGRANVVPASVALEVFRQLRVAGIPLAAAGDLGGNVPIGDRDVLDLGDLAQDEEDLHPLLGIRSEVGMELLMALAGHLLVRLFADPLAGESS